MVHSRWSLFFLCLAFPLETPRNRIIVPWVAEVEGNSSITA